MSNRYSMLDVEGLEPEVAPSKAQEKKKETKPRADKKPPTAGAGNRPPKREFDRHSGTGRGTAPQKNGAGRHHWGDKTNPVTELENETAPIPESPVEEPAAEVTAPKEPEKPKFTVEEYMKMKKRCEGEGFEEKAVRSVETIEAEKIVKIEEDFFVGEGAKKADKKKKKAKKTTAADLISFTVVDKIVERPPRAPREDRPRGDRPPRRFDGEQGDRPPRRFDGEQGDRPPRRFDGEQGDRPPRRFDGERGDRPPRRFDGEQGDRPPRRFDGEQGDRPPRRFDGERGDRPPRRFDGEQGDRPPRRFDGEQGDRPPRRFDGEQGDRPPRRFDGEQGDRPPRRFDGERGDRPPRRFDGERGDRPPRRGGRNGDGRSGNAEDDGFQEVGPRHPRNSRGGGRGGMRGGRGGSRGGRPDRAPRTEAPAESTDNQAPY